MAAISAGTAIAVASLAAGLKTGVTQKAAKGDIGGAVSTAGDKLLGMGKKAPEPIAPIQTKVSAPSIDQDAIKKARTARLASLQQASGRASTLLTNKFGG